MTILLTNENRAFGGAEVHTLELAQGLKEKGHQVRLVAQPGSWLAETACLQGLTVETVAMRNEVDPIAISRLYRLLGSVDVVQCQATRDLILTTTANRLGPRKPLFKAEHSYLGSHRSRLCDWAYRSATCLVVVSQALKKQMQQELGHLRFEVIANGIDLTRASPAYPPDPQLEGRYVGVLSQLVESKGQRDFLEVLPRLAADHPELRFLIAGEGPDRAWLESRATELGVEVTFTGFATDPLATLASLEVVCVPSHEETFSLVCLEALALAKPLVAARTGGIPEVVGGAGRLFEPGDRDDLLAALREVLARPAAWSERARARAKQFSLQTMVARYERLYQEVA